MKSIYQKDPFIGVSHRGNSKNYIENSFEAFSSVIQMDYKYIETDLRMTLDEEVIRQDQKLITEKIFISQHF